MISFKTLAMTVALTAVTGQALAVAPTYMISENKTHAQSNSYIAGKFASPYPTDAGKTKKLFWQLVKVACFGNTKTDPKTKHSTCDAEIHMETKQAKHKILGWMKMDLDTGDITPKSLSKYGYTLTVKGPGHVVITE